MACFHPSKVSIYRDMKTHENCKVIFKPRYCYAEKTEDSLLWDVRRIDGDWYKCDEEVLVPCGHCVGCAIDISRDWSYRMMCEKESSKNAWFLTLTYDEEHLPNNHQLNKKHLDDFIKKLRNYYYDLGLDNIRYYACGEYGSKTARPHYHMIVYNLPLTPLEFTSFGVKYKSSHKYKTVGQSIDKTPLYQFDLLNDLWQKGFVVVGEVTVNSCAYVARYVNKKRMSGVKNEDLKKKGIVPEFNCMSRMPGIGVPYYEKHYDEIITKNLEFYSGSTRLSVGRSFEKWLEKNHPDRLEEYKAIKEKKALYGYIYTQNLLLQYGDVNKGLEHDEELKQSAYNTLKRNV